MYTLWYNPGERCTLCGITQVVYVHPAVYPRWCMCTLPCTLGGV